MNPLQTASPTIVLGLAREDAALEWADELGRALPHSRIVRDAPDAPPADYAVLWRPQPGFFARQPNLKAVFAAGAGVDWLLADPQLPATLPVYRVEDGGMAEQMAAYTRSCVFTTATTATRRSSARPSGKPGPM